MENLLEWIALKNVHGIGNHLFKRLLDCFHSPHNVFQAPRQELLKTAGISQHLVRAIKQQQITDWMKKELELVQQKGYQIITQADDNFPSLLLEIPDPPPFLYVNGNLLESSMNIAVIGSRNATSYGITMTKQLCKELAGYQATIVSGMARGIDTAAHLGAMEGGGQTIAVLGSGLAQIYPAENRKLFHEIAETGAVISEFPMHSAPEAHHFPIRNRIISGISLGSVVVEAAKKSGSLITARLAAEQNREVFAVPGSILSFKSSGAHALIKQGAKLVENAQDILEELSPVFGYSYIQQEKKAKPAGAKALPLSSDESKVFSALGPYPVHIDDLTRKLTIDAGKLAGILLQLELKGVIKQSPGKLFSTQ